MVKILKIGGSVLTDKSRPSYARIDEIKRISSEISSVSSDLILVHGAGSFGHVQAKEYGLPQKFNPKGLWKTHESVVKLNNMIVEALSIAGANPMPVHPFSCITLKDGRIDDFCCSSISEMVKRNLLPVLHGDVAMDITRGSGIVSGDQLVSYLSRALKADLVAIGTDVDGVLFNRKVLPTITRDEISRIEVSLSGSSHADVTGGMKGKLLELIELAEGGIDSIIFNALIDGQTQKALKGYSIGTKVRRSN
jgi:isopentenyl phosphate kinase